MANRGLTRGDDLRDLKPRFQAMVLVAIVVFIGLLARLFHDQKLLTEDVPEVVIEGVYEIGNILVVRLGN